MTQALKCGYNNRKRQEQEIPCYERSADLRTLWEIRTYIYFSNSAGKVKTEEKVAYFVQWDSSKVE